jgi:hypothetical protein
VKKGVQEDEIDVRTAAAAKILKELQDKHEIEGRAAGMRVVSLVTRHRPLIGCQASRLSIIPSRFVPPLYQCLEIWN